MLKFMKDIRGVLGDGLMVQVKWKVYANLQFFDLHLALSGKNDARYGHSYSRWRI